MIVRPRAYASVTVYRCFECAGILRYLIVIGVSNCVNQELLTRLGLYSHVCTICNGFQMVKSVTCCHLQSLQLDSTSNWNVLFVYPFADAVTTRFIQIA
ncbi:hypothetical protein HNV12_07325 [Methanococcoides sp. SA1]|nr:hypothetical protein [Methanococcoides sp. SA1]